MHIRDVQPGPCLAWASRFRSSAVCVMSSMAAHKSLGHKRHLATQHAYCCLLTHFAWLFLLLLSHTPTGRDSAVPCHDAFTEPLQQEPLSVAQHHHRGATTQCSQRTTCTRVLVPRTALAAGLLGHLYREGAGLVACGSKLCCHGRADGQVWINCVYV